MEPVPGEVTWEEFATVVARPVFQPIGVWGAPTDLARFAIEVMRPYQGNPERVDLVHRFGYTRRTKQNCRFLPPGVGR